MRGRSLILVLVVWLMSATALLAQTAAEYINSGLAKFRLNDLAGAEADYDRAIALNPNYALAYYNRGNVKHDRNDLAGAEADFDRVIAQEPTNTAAYSTRGLIRDNRGNFAGALSDYAARLKLSPDDSDYIRFRLVLVLRRQSADDGPAGLATAVAQAEKGWTKNVGLFLQGITAEADFFNQAAVGDTQAVREQQCEAYYYAGMTRLIKGELGQAREYFEKCKGTGITNFSEYDFAEAELARMR